MRKLFSVPALLLCASFALFGQASLTSTTLAAAISDTKVTTISVTSATGFTAGSTVAFVDNELMEVKAVSGTVITVRRGANGFSTPHANSSTIYVGPPNYFIATDKFGSCTATNELVLPTINVRSGRRWNCINGQWMVDNGVLELGPGACYTTVSGNSTGTNGFTVAGASNTPVMQAQTSATGTNTHTFLCNITIPTFLAGKGAAITDVVFKYGVQTTALGTQVATLSSGTLNSTTVFSYIAFPAPGASETASTVAPVRADSGSITLTPAVASFNTATTTAGAFYTELFTPASAIPVPVGATDRRQLLFTVALLNTATSATVTNSPGLTVHYAYVPNDVFTSGR